MNPWHCHVLWHGYPQHPDAHPERPWWRRQSPVVPASAPLADHFRGVAPHGDHHVVKHADTCPERPGYKGICDCHYKERLARHQRPGMHEAREIWVRSDGWTVTVRDGGESGFDGKIAARLAEEDRARPLPVPPALCGQVWKYPGGDDLTSCLVLNERGPLVVDWVHEVLSDPGEIQVFPADDLIRSGAVLVAGPLSPWASDA